MGHDSPEAIKKHIRAAVFVFAMLLVLTGVTYAVAYYDMGHGVNVTVALVIATSKATLVCLYFMHLISEKALIYWVLVLAAVFFVFLIALPVITNHAGITL